MNTPQAQTVVVTVGLGVMALAMVGAAQAGQRPPVQRVVGAALGTIGLSAIANVAPQIAGPAALLWGFSALIVGGAPALAAVKSATGSAPAAPANPAHAAPRTYSV